MRPKELVVKNRRCIIAFTDYCLNRMRRRRITVETVKSLLVSVVPLTVVIQKVIHKGEIEVRYKVIYRLSSRYFLILVISYEATRLNVINAIKTSKDLERKWLRKMSK